MRRRQRAPIRKGSGFAPFAEPGGRDRSLSVFDDVRQVKHHAVRSGIPTQNGHEQGSVASAGINDFAEPAKIVGRSDAGTVVLGNIVMAPSNTFASSGCCVKCPKGSVIPNTFLSPVSPVLTEWSSSPPRLPEER